MHFLITGHTGFKGTWLTLLLKELGHEVSGLSLAPETKSLFNQTILPTDLKYDIRQDIRDLAKLSFEISRINPEILIHFAAQPLVRESYKKPLETFDTNVMGTLNCLEATLNCSNLQTALIITTDKVYKNSNIDHGYVEEDKLGGDDPYSASKAAADMASQSWIKNFATIPIGIARAGNVIGGGDWSQDRLVPDLVDSYKKGKIPQLRYPHSTRPWQHVLDCLNGYLLLIDYQLSNKVSDVWNFGPSNNSMIKVVELVERFGDAFNVQGPKFQINNEFSYPESGKLFLNSTKARNYLGWNDKLNLENTVEWTYSWYKEFSKESARKNTLAQIEQYLQLN
jgi:CDP-glucose 4,6-dehydratase